MIITYTTIPVLSIRGLLRKARPPVDMCRVKSHKQRMTRDELSILSLMGVGHVFWNKLLEEFGTL